MTVEERLTEIADRIVAFRTRDARLDVARRLVESTGSASADEIAAALADWAPPDGQQLADLVARKCEAAVAVAEAVVIAAREARRIHGEKAEKLYAQAEAAHAAAVEPVDETALVEARELLDAALTAGGVPGRAPVGRSMSVTPQVAGPGG